MPNVINQDPNPAPGDSFSEQSKSDWKRLEALTKQGKALRRNWEDPWDDVYRQVFPERQGFADRNRIDGEQRMDLIFDETAIVEMPRFVSRIVDGMFPPNNRAFMLAPHPGVDRSKRAKMEKDLKARTEFYHEILRNSNFYTEIHESINDLGVGTMTMDIQPGPFQGDMIFTALPLTQMYLIPGPFGPPDVWLRLREMLAADIQRQWKRPTKTHPNGAQLSQDLEKRIKRDPFLKVKVWDIVTRVRDASSEHKFDFMVGVEDTKEVVYKDRVEGIGANSRITTRWFCDAGETYGRGVLLQALPAIKSANLTMELIYQNAQMAIGGTYVYDDDGTFNFDNVTIEPGTFIPRSPGSAIEELRSASRFDISQLILDETRQNIRRALFSSAPDRPQGRTPPSATEIAEDRAETARNMGSAITRLQYEFMIPLVQRMTFILKTQGVDLPQVDGKEIILVPESPLLRSQDQQDIADFLRYMEALQFSMGEAAPAALQPGPTIQYLAAKHRIPQELVPSEAEIKQRADQAVQVAQQTQAQQ